MKIAIIKGSTFPEQSVQSTKKDKNIKDCKSCKHFDICMREEKFNGNITICNYYEKDTNIKNFVEILKEEIKENKNA